MGAQHECAPTVAPMLDATCWTLNQPISFHGLLTMLAKGRTEVAATPDHGDPFLASSLDRIALRDQSEPLQG